MKPDRNSQDPLVDVRTAAEFAAGHIPKAISIPLDTMDAARVVPGSRLYCRTGRRSAMAQAILKDRGIEVTNLGGIEDYDGPLEK